MAMRVWQYDAKGITLHPTKHDQSYLRSHWTLPLGKYLPRIAPAVAMVINFAIQNRVVVL